MIDPDDKEAFLALTTCDDLRSLRISRRVQEELDRMRTLRTGARVATEVRSSTVDRVRRRLVEGPLPARRPAFRWGLAVVALAAVFVAFLVGRHPVSGGQGTVALASSDVSLELDGLGTVGGTQQSPEIRWESGTLRVAVTPNRNVRLAVVTPEATVRVVGTAFSVDRGEFATAVSVSHGTVEVTCTGRAAERVSAPGTRRCLPDDAPTLLRRVSALRRSAASSEERLETIDAGLAAATDGGPLTAELLAHRADLLATTGRDGEAMDAATAYLELGGPRQAEMNELLAGFGCAGLERVAAREPTGGWAVRLAECLVDADPDRARRILDGVVDPGDGASLAADLRVRLGAGR